MEKSKGNPSSQLVGGAIRQELDRLWAELRRVQPIAGAGQRARYTTGGVIIESQCCGGEGEASAPVPVGACCDGVACEITTEAACLAPKSWLSAGTCAPNNCVTPIMSCCVADGSCTLKTFSECAATEGAWGQSDTCTPNPCSVPPPPVPTGSCCAADGTCLITTQAACSGTWTSGGNCSPNICTQPPPTGSCCNSAVWQCTTTTAAACAYTWTEAGNCGNCAPPPPPATGACCSAGVCSETTQTGCTNIGGVFQGAGIFCSPNPCGAPPVTGRCCHGDGSCSVTAAAACVGVLDVWAAGEDCTTSAAMCFGACCFPQGCMIFDAAGCAAMGGSFNGNGTTCQPDPCVAPPPPTGSCCAPFTNACSVVTQSTCAIISGTWVAGGVCQPDPCVSAPPPPATGRCCAADGSCSMTTQAACAGIAWLENFTCATPCPQPPTGSCCVSGGTCVDALAPGSAGTAIGGGVCEANQNYIAGVFCAARSCLGGCCWFHPSLGNICAVQGATPINNEFDCNFASGTTFYPGGDCFSCSQHFTADYPGGACCDLAGGCTLTRFADCVGLWLPDDVCWDDGCPSPSTGACCRMIDGLPDCHLDTAANCDATGGQFTPNTVCADVLCPPQREIVGACCDAAGLCFDGATIQTCASTSTFYAGLNCFDAMCVPFTG